MAYEKKKSSKTVWITILVIILLIAAVVAGIMIGRSHSGPQNLNYTKGGTDSAITNYTGTTVEESAEVESTIDEDNKIVQINMGKAIQIANSKYPGYDFELEALHKGADGRFYYSLEGVDSHGNVKDIRVDALDGSVSAEK